ncbi:MptD family putative ECF transporter S component [Bifidobacterium cuniculi]|uniref:Permease n=1 Tax=Bifidobacterium cuniculi TaxID=1688 RepID=A0A087B2M1_9BIFI|nr:MptD family putative ECF transporter S component [Bifidobacterium cuniculi]KFI65271.1 permease [Bifidobacterium cuniculi]
MTQEMAAGRTRAKLSVSDMITVGVFSALYFCICGVAMLIVNLCFGLPGTILLPAVTALLAGPVFMLLAARVRRFGAITVMGVVLGFVLFLAGHFATSLVTAIVFPLLADCIAQVGRHRNRIALMASYAVFSFGCAGPIVPMWMMRGAYVASLQRKGKDTATIDAIMANVNGTSLVVVIVATIACALVGGWLGLRMNRRHFAKAGVA